MSPIQPTNYTLHFGSRRLPSSASSVPTATAMRQNTSDRIEFGQQSQTQNSDDSGGDSGRVAKRRQVDQAALKLFAKATSTKDLIHHFKATYGDRIELFNGAQPGQEWVDDVCKTMGPPAFVKVPDSLLFGDNPNDLSGYQQVDPDLQQTASNQKALETYVKQALAGLHKHKKMGIFIRSDMDETAVKHELYHCLQFIHGVPLAMSNRHLDQEAERIINTANQGLTGKGFIDMPLKALHRIWQWATKVPYILATKPVKNPPKGTVGEAIRTKMQAEKDVDRLFLSNPQMAGINGWFSHALHYFFESQLKYLLSFQYD